MSPEQLALEYLEALELGDHSRLMGLFAEEAVVVSPLYGSLPATDFYRKLFEDTQDSQLSLLEVFHQGSEAKLAIYFRFHWRLKDQTLLSFDVVDILELEGEKIKKLTIIYDTHHTRSAFQGLKA